MTTPRRSMISQGGGPAMVDRRLLLSTLLVPVMIFVPASLERLGPLKWIGLHLLLPALVLGALTYCLLTYLWLRRLVLKAAANGCLCCGACGHVLRGSRAAVCPECGAERPRDRPLRLAWLRYVPFVLPFRKGPAQRL